MDYREAGSGSSTSRPNRGKSTMDERRRRRDDGIFINQRGQMLSYCTFFPSTKSSAAIIKGVFVFLHDLGNHCRRYLHVFEQLRAQGFIVLAYDMISHGRSDNCSDNLRMHARKFQFFVDDTNEFISKAINELYRQQQLYRLPLILCGDGFGGMVAIHTVLSGTHTFSGLVLAAPPVAIEWTMRLRLQAMLSKPLALLIPKAHVVPNANADAVCRDPGRFEDFANDPLTTYTPLTVRMGDQIRRAMLALEKEPQFDQPQSVFCKVSILFMVGSANQIMDVEQVKKFYDKLACGDKEWKIFDGVYHSLFDDPEQDDIVAFLAEWLVLRWRDGGASSSLDASSLSVSSCPTVSSCGMSEELNEH